MPLVLLALPPVLMKFVRSSILEIGQAMLNSHTLTFVSHACKKDVANLMLGHTASSM